MCWYNVEEKTGNNSSENIDSKPFEVEVRLNSI